MLNVGYNFKCTNQMEGWNGKNGVVLAESAADKLKLKGAQKFSLGCIWIG